MAAAPAGWYRVRVRRGETRGRAAYLMTPEG